VVEEMPFCRPDRRQTTRSSRLAIESHSHLAEPLKNETPPPFFQETNSPAPVTDFEIDFWTPVHKDAKAQNSAFVALFHRDAPRSEGGGAEGRGGG
jgi:hypothetical protein